MAFETYSRAVADLLRAGVFDYLNGYMARGRLPRDIVDRIRDTYGRLNPVSWQAANAVVNRYRAAREAGRALNRRRTDNPLDRDAHIGYLAEQGQYVYETVARLIDNRTGKTITQPITVVGTQPLGAQSIREDALSALADLISRQSIGSPPGGHSDYSLVGDIQITMALSAGRER